MVDATRHGLNLFVVFVGETSKARKGTSWNQIRRLFAEVDQSWIDTRVTPNLSSLSSLNSHFFVRSAPVWRKPPRPRPRSFSN